MLFDDIEVLLVLSKAKSLSQAAGQLYMSRPGLSQKIAAIEKQLGTSLINRTSTGISLTQAGKVAVKFAQNMADMERATQLVASGVIEIAPLAFMRGRTLNDSFIILDEAQNTTPEQMKMFLTRLGFGSKMVVTGDVTQLDLPRGVSGLKGVRAILEDIDDIAFCDFTGKDVVRHSLVAAIVSAYDQASRKA